MPVFRQVAGEIRRIEVSSGDTLVSIGARVGVPWRVLAERNKLDNPNRIYRGQVLEADTRRIVPAVLDEGLVVNVPEAALYRFETGVFTARFTVGLGRPQSPTPVGSFTVLQKERFPGAPAPVTLLAELETEADIARRKVNPDAGSSLGELWIQLSSWGYGIHATPFAATLGQFLGYGSIRAAPTVVSDLYAWVNYGTAVEVVYHPVKLAVTPAGEIWAEAHGDVYGQGFPDTAEVLEALREGAPGGRVDEERLWDVLVARRGVAQLVGEVPAPNGTAGAANPLAEVASAEAAAQWRCLDCPPGARRRVTFQLQARAPLQLPNPYPLRILNDANLVVFRPQMVAQATVDLARGEQRNFVWEVRDTDGQPLPPGSYAAVVEFIDAGGTRQVLSLPLWVGK
ncbi:MAG: LysM peptidoglycan-binding domain-containing protein [Deferrisomatales bacterium]|nr:LysM peptidoglycan-binding domain-containing protein [Deferrisomatales bacterium]